MRRELLHIYGPFSIYSYGVAIAIGLLIFYLLIQYNPRYKKLGLHNRFIDIILTGIVLSLVGGRLLYMFSEPDDIISIPSFFSFWNGGLSILGAVIANVIGIPILLYSIRIPILPFMDFMAIYVPLLQSIARVGCFFAGCCWGANSYAPWAIVYTSANTTAPRFIALHPTQLYSSLALLMLFLLFYCFLQHTLKKPGQLITAYLICVSMERFIVDFWRGDRNFINQSFLPEWVSSTLSANQLVALGIFLGASILFFLITFTYKKRY
jgi:phosphatidylglycerol:prolipoprotein diacylglycerol transferase